MRVIAGSCPDTNCPKILDPEDGSGDLLVQGYRTGMKTPEGEEIVRIPAAHLAEAVDLRRAEGGL